MPHPVQRRWYPIVLAVAALVLMPLSVLLLSWHEVDQQIWTHLWQTQMARLIGNTVTLAVRALRQDRVGADLSTSLRDDEVSWLDADLG